MTTNFIRELQSFFQIFFLRFGFCHKNVSLGLGIFNDKFGGPGVRPGAWLPIKVKAA